jgi:hypothetical protein
VAGFVVLSLAPSLLLAQRRGPVLEMTGPETSTLLVPASEVAIAVGIELLATTTLTAGILGWLVGRTRRSALVTGLAGLAFALGPGHNIPLLGGTPAVPKELLLLAVSIAVAAVTLVEVDARSGPRHPT